MIDSQVDVDYESGDLFFDAFKKALGGVLACIDGKALSAAWLDTPLGPMLIIADDDYLYLLEFFERRGLEREIERLRKCVKIGIIPGETKITKQIKSELKAYFSGTCFEFKTPCFWVGTDFQKQVWEALKTIPVGETRSYKALAELVGSPKGCRAVARANGSNQLAIIIPCHRVINHNGELGGYAGGLSRKTWLLEHESG